MRTNFPAVFVSALLYWLLGALWYGVLFSKPYMALENISAGQTHGNEALPYIITFALNMLIAFMLAQICGWRSVNTAGQGAAIGILLWVGIIGPISFTTYMYEMRPMGLFAINEFYSLVGLCLMGAVLGAWGPRSSSR